MNRSNPVEFMVPNKAHVTLLQEHLNRYAFSLGFVRNRIVLDIACGTGYGTAMLSGTANIVIGADISRRALGYAKKHYSKIQNATFILSDAHSMPFRNNILDTIVSLETVEHLIHLERFLREVKRTLVKRGYLIVSTPNKKLSSSRAEKDRNPFHVREFSAEELSKILTPFFADLQLYGQHYCTVKDWLFGIVQGYLPFIPFPIWLKELGRLGRALREPRTQKRTRRRSSSPVIDPSFHVKTFIDLYPILTPAFLIAVTRK